MLAGWLIGVQIRIRHAIMLSHSLAEQILEKCKALDALQFGEFKLTSGLTSNYYFDGRLLTLSPDGANLVAQALLPAIRESGALAVGVAASFSLLLWRQMQSPAARAIRKVRVVLESDSGKGPPAP